MSKANRNSKNGKRAGIENRVLVLSALSPHPRNYQRHSDAQISDLRESLKQFGQVRSIVVQKSKANGHYVIVAGHGIADAAKREGLKTLRADVIPLHWSKTRVLAYLAADNELARYGDPDQDQLAAIVRDVMNAEGESLALLAAGEKSALDALLASANVKEETADVGELVDRAAELQKKWNVKRGDIFEIESKTVRGKCHRVMCGDSTNAEDVARLMDGEKAELVVTSPPYWIGKDYEQEKTNEAIDSFVVLIVGNMAGVVDESGRIVINVAVARRHLAVGGNIEVRLNLDDWQNALRRNNWLMRHVRCWVKNGALSGTSPASDAIDQNWEFVATFYNPRGKKRGQNRVNESWAMRGIWDDVNGVKQETHSAPFDVEIPTRVIKLYANDRANVYEPFLGSGTTLVACEQTGRVGRGLEIEPRYVSVSLERLSLLGLTPKRVTESRTNAKRKHTT